MRISELMQRRVFTCRADQSLNDAARLMWEHAVGVLPVLDAQGHVVALLTDRDVAMGAYTTGQPLAEIAVGVAMSKTLISVRASQDVAAAVELMREHHVRRVPVVDGVGHIAGLLSIDDIASHLSFGYDGAAGACGGDAIAMTLAATSDRTPEPAPPEI